MNAEEWDERYRAADLVWGIAPNRWVEAELRDLPPARALDLACGEGRNALWLASLGWQVTAVDFSAVAIEKARELQAVEATATPVTWVHADATTYQSSPVDCALLCYFQLVAHQRRQAVRNAAAALEPGGTLLVVGHDSRNLNEGVGGPQDPAVLFTAQDIIDDLDGLRFKIEKAEAVDREVTGADRPAIDALVRATAP